MVEIYDFYFAFFGTTLQASAQAKKSQKTRFMASFGPIKIIPQLTVLVHEINVATTKFLPEETHILEDYNFPSLIKDAKDWLFFQKILDTHYVNLSSLWLSSASLEMVNLLILLKRIDKKLNP